MSKIPFSLEEVDKFRVKDPKAAVDLCASWQSARKFLEYLRALPFVPQEVKDAIDWIVKFGDALCP